MRLGVGLGMFDKRIRLGWVGGWVRLGWRVGWVGWWVVLEGRVGWVGGWDWLGLSLANRIL